MPNQRHADKRALNCWVSSALHDQLRALATARGLPLTALVTAILTDYAAKHKPPSEQPEQ